MSSFYAGDTESISSFTTQAHSGEANACIENKKYPELHLIKELLNYEFEHYRHYFEIAVAAVAAA